MGITQTLRATWLLPGKSEDVRDLSNPPIRNLSASLLSAAAPIRICRTESCQLSSGGTRAYPSNPQAVAMLNVMQLSGLTCRPRWPSFRDSTAKLDGKIRRCRTLLLLCRRRRAHDAA